MSVNGTATPTEGQRKSSEQLDHLELYIKSGQDGMSQGGCPFCQRIFMVLMIKHTQRALTFTATVVDQAHPPKDWKYGLKLPVLVHKDEVLDEVEEMCSYIDKYFPDPPMPTELPAANNACINAFSKFNYYVKSPSAREKGPGPMVGELRKLSDYLEKVDIKYLCADELSHLDCIMLPKLQHIRLVAKAFKEFEIPSDLKGLWRYLGNAYQEPVFTETCPSDQEIVQHWVDRPGLPRLSKEQANYYRTTSKPRYSFDIPEGLRTTPPASEEKSLTQNDVFEPETPKTPTSPDSLTTPLTPASPEPEKNELSVYEDVSLPPKQNSANEDIPDAVSKQEVISETVVSTESAPPVADEIYSTIDDNNRDDDPPAVITSGLSYNAVPESDMSEASEKSNSQKLEKSDVVADVVAFDTTTTEKARSESGVSEASDKSETSSNIQTSKSDAVSEKAEKQKADGGADDKPPPYNDYEVLIGEKDASPNADSGKNSPKYAAEPFPFEGY